jgi:hypothetical protein
MVDPCKACAEIICIGICTDRAQYKQEYQEMTDLEDSRRRNSERYGERRYGWDTAFCGGRYASTRT